jgi:hypothetical protein
MYFGTGDAAPTDLTARAAAARRTRGDANRRPARPARQSPPPRDQGVLTAVRPPGPAGPLVWRRRPLRSGWRGRPSRPAEPCPGSASFSRGRPRRLNDENSRGKVQDVRADSSVTGPPVPAEKSVLVAAVDVAARYGYASGRDDVRARIALYIMTLRPWARSPQGGPSSQYGALRQLEPGCERSARSCRRKVGTGTGNGTNFGTPRRETAQLRKPEGRKAQSCERLETT